MMTTVKGFDLSLRTEFENLDTNTLVYAVIREVGGDPVSPKKKVAQGEVPDNESHAPEYIPLLEPDRYGPDTNFEIELEHPGAPHNPEPHWRMTFRIDAVLSDGSERSCDVNLSEALNFSDKKFGHLNFVDAKRRSGPIRIRIK